MYKCNGCGGYLKFDIETQKLKCESCSTLYNVPDEAQQNMNAEYEAKVYTCPQCGGELISEDNEAVVFCSFCGASNVLKERYSKEKRPSKIIPFKKTKKEIKELYAARLKKAFFAPSDLKDPEFIDSFRGIYMPFYLYEADVDQPLRFDAETVERFGDDEVITTYRYNGYIKEHIEDLPHDASSTFADDISEAIMPYDSKELNDFSTGYMSGFYADTSDVKEDLYAENIGNLARESAAMDIQQNLEDADAKSDLKTLIQPNVHKAGIGMFPVWFLSYKNRDRMAYAAVNGLTGKMAVDIPVDMKKFLLWVLIIAVPIFVILNFAVTIPAKAAMAVSGVFGLLALIIALIVRKRVSVKASGQTDRGSANKNKEKKSKIMPFVIFSIITLVLIAGVYAVSPVSDVPYYCMAILCIIAVLLEMFALTKAYNKLSTRPMPQFKRKGGDDRA